MTRGDRFEIARSFCQTIYRVSSYKINYDMLAPWWVKIRGYGMMVGDLYKYLESCFEQDYASIKDDYPSFYENTKRKSEETWFEIVSINGDRVSLKRCHHEPLMYADAEPVSVSVSELNSKFYKI